ncbi:MAG TPA: valine--tRNA ligase [Sphingomonadaceae bacterium]|nr:valine--tRNA ligase [Sphingomonadaceae bacterium]
MTELPKTFDPAAIETRWYAHWEAEGRFRPARPDAEPFTIVIPPPNVTGSLHIGHALDLTLQDILTRHARLRGRDALWVVGTDHAGIATQMVVERQMAERQQKRTDFSREEFVAKVWEWKEESGGAITAQLRRLGASCDWANERFTMDPGFSRAVIKVFVDLYNRKLLYRDKRLVNWDPGLKTAISDLEVETREVQGKFWHLSYPLADGSGAISVATTRPETLLADMAVAVNPADERYTHLVGKQVRLPITGRLVPIVADEHANPELGSGAVKVTPGHDFNDFEVGRRAGFKAADMLNMLDGDANVIQTADGLIPDELLGLDRVEARKRVVALVEAAGLLEKVEDRVIQTPLGDRSGAVIEPWLTDQWYVDAATLAGPAIAAVRSGDIRVVPETWKKTWFNWLENIQPWCVSRQLWWGHQIPAWFDEAGRVYVAETEAEAQAQAGQGVALTRDPDVLDTWFSSALWPFATLGWPEETEMLRRHYPNDVLISGFDIIFFWDARMAMQGYEFMGERPWKTLYLHGLVRDATGAKMSKSKGNTVDPLGLIDRYGADALRFTLAAMESQGRDIKLDEKRIEGYRNFATKLWNAARFAQANGIGASATIEPPAATLPVNRWIVGEAVRTVQALDLALAELRFDEAARLIYQFTWDRFCDWYLELIKPVLSAAEGPVLSQDSPSPSGEGLGWGSASTAANQEDSPTPNPSPEGEGLQKDETRAVAAWVLDQILVMLHPFMPFITEELWHAMGPRPYDLILAKWPIADARALDPEAGPEIDWLIRLVSGIRAARTELGVAPGVRLPLHVAGASEVTAARLARHGAALERMARLTGVSSDPAPPGGAAQVIVDEAVFVLPLEGVIDIAAERARLAKAQATAEKERDALARRLESPGFAQKAKPEAIDKARADHAERSAEAERFAAALARLG